MSSARCHQKQVIHNTLLPVQKAAYGTNDAPRRWWNILDTALCSCGLIPTRSDRRCYGLYSTQTCKPNWNKRCSTQAYGTNDISLESRARSRRHIAFENMLDAIDGSPATGKSVAGITILFVDDLFGTGGNKFEQRVLDQTDGFLCFHTTWISDKVAKWQPARVGTFVTLILRQLPFMDSLIV